MRKILARSTTIYHLPPPLPLSSFFIRIIIIKKCNSGNSPPASISPLLLRRYSSDHLPLQIIRESSAEGPGWISWFRRWNVTRRSKQIAKYDENRDKRSTVLDGFKLFACKWYQKMITVLKAKYSIVCWFSFLISLFLYKFCGFYFFIIT